MNDRREHRRQSWNELPLQTRLELNRKLSARQNDCYRLWIAGCGYETIAEYLSISRSTAVTHVKRARAIRAQLEEAA